MYVRAGGVRQSEAQQLPRLQELPSCPERSYYELAMVNACCVR